MKTSETYASRSLLMSRIKSKDTKPELAVRSFLHRRGFRYALHRRDLPGTPDIVLSRYRTVVFVHGCLWHGHRPCSKYLPPATRQEYWLPKIRANRRRDAKQRRELKQLGWRVDIVWECQIGDERLLEARLSRQLRGRASLGPPSPREALRDRSTLARFEARSAFARMVKALRRLRRALISASRGSARRKGPPPGSREGFDPYAELRED
jgi:DNA mismatch endonuclease, patch repair protein